jgi:predicted HicB family RNase H-like nuclease
LKTPGMSVIRRSRLKEAFEISKEIFAEQKKDMPTPLKDRNYSGQFRLKIPKELHYELVKRVIMEKVSLISWRCICLQKACKEKNDDLH